MKPRVGAGRRTVFTLGLLVALATSAAAQQILIDRGLRVAGLWVFPLVSNPREYVYIPAQARLSLDEAGNPQFSFIRYVVNRPGEDTDATITRSAGGGVINFLVQYDTAQGMIDDAQRLLRDRLRDDEAAIRGPLVFSDGRYALVSSIIDPQSGRPGRKLLATGRAPVLEGNRIALSFDLQPQEASLLLESLKMDTPDVSIMFDMTFTGLNEAYDAELYIDWSEVRNTRAFSAGGSIYFVSADVEMAFDEMMRNNAIRLRSSGTDAAMEALLDSVYGKLLELMFRPVEPERVPPEQRGGLMDALGALTDPRSGALSSRRTTRFGLYAGFQLKELKTSGVSVLNFNHRASVDRHALIAFNIGDLHRRYGEDRRFFRDFNLADAVYEQREVHVAVDGALLKDFDRYINTVTVTLRKTHQDGSETLREVVMDRESFNREPGSVRMVYGWSGDHDRLAWLTYQYRTRWSFTGGGSHETNWTDTDAPMIGVFTPYEARTVQVLGDPEAMRQAGVRAATVRIEYPFFGQSRVRQLVVRPGASLEEAQAEITLPLGQYEYDYTITWHLEGGRRLVLSGTDTSGLIFVDELPPE